MAGKLCKENIPVERLVGRGSAQATAETSVMLSGGDRNVALVSCRALPALGAVEVQTGGVAAQGTVEFSALYLTQEGALFSREAQANFSAVMQVEEAAPRMRARVRATIERVEAEEKDGRLDFAAEIRLEGVVVEAAAEALGTGIESETPMAERRARLWARVRAAQGETRLAVSETFPLADPAFARVVYAEAHAQTDPAKVRDGAAEVSGAVTVDCLLSGAEGAQAVGWQRETIPFSQEIQAEGFREGRAAQTGASVRGLRCEVVFPRDEEEQEGRLRVEYVLELSAEAGEEAGAEVLADAYPLSDAPFQAERESVRFIRADEREEQTQTLQLEIELPAGQAGFGEIVGAFAAPSALDIVDGEEGTVVEGLLRVSLLYRAGGEGELRLYTQEAPFALEYPGLNSTQVREAELGAAAFERVSPTQAQVRVPLRLQTQRVDTAEMEVISGFHEEGEAAALPTGAILYYPDPGETLWEVGKRYRIAEEELRARNPEEKAPLLIYRRLTGF